MPKLTLIKVLQVIGDQLPKLKDTKTLSPGRVLNRQLESHRSGSLLGHRKKCT